MSQTNPRPSRIELEAGNLYSDGANRSSMRTAVTAMLSLRSGIPMLETCFLVYALRSRTLHYPIAYV
jgi:hypothetical protein